MAQPKLQNTNHPVPAWVGGLICALVALWTFWPVLELGWTYYDDTSYVWSNTQIHQLTLGNIWDLFARPAIHGAYMPLTFTTLAFDYALAGQEAQWYHLVNLLLHVANVSLVYVLCHRLSGRQSIAFLACLLFATYPTQVEPVAWIASRKDVLYSFFYLLGMHAYWTHLLRARPGFSKFFLATFFFCLLSLCSKPMAITFPFCLLLLDYWHGRSDFGSMLREKVAFFALTLLFVYLGVSAQQSGEAMLGMEQYPWLFTPITGGHNAMIYLLKCIVPWGLTSFYPYPFESVTELPPTYYLMTLLLVVLIVVAIRSRRQAKILVFGLGFFLVCLLPVLQILPFGRAMMADRFTYLGYVGLFFILASGAVQVHDWLRSVASRLAYLWLLLLIAYVGLLTYSSHQRCAVWRDGETFWSDAIDHYPAEDFLYRARASYRLAMDDHSGARDDLNRSLALNDASAAAYEQRGRANEKLGRVSDALSDYTRAIALDSTHGAALLHRGLLHLRQGQSEWALRDLTAATIVAPAYLLAHLNRAVLLEILGRHEEARLHYDRAIALDPKDARTYQYRGAFLLGRQDYMAALADLNESIDLNATQGSSYHLRSIVYLALDQKEQAVLDAKRALELGHDVDRKHMEALGWRD